MDVVIDNVRVEKITFGHLFFIINIFSDMKNYMFLSLFLIGAISALLITSCEKDDDGGMDNPEPELAFPGDCQIESYIIVPNGQLDTNQYRHFYDLDENLERREGFNSDTLISTTAYERDELGRVIKLEYYDSEGELTSHREYQYIGDSDIVSTYSVYLGTGNVLSHIYITYEEGTNRVIKDSVYFVPLDIIDERIYEYDDVNHTRTELLYANGTTYSGKIVTTYDPELTQPFLKTSPLYHRSPFAIVSYESYDEDDVLKEIDSYTIAYDVDEENGTIHMTYNYQSGAISETIISYDCE